MTRHDITREKMFLCAITYTTPAGRWVEVRESVFAIAADLAVEKAEALLRADKRRVIGKVVYVKAVQA